MALALHVALDYFLSAANGVGRELERLYSTNQLVDMYALVAAFSAAAILFVLVVDVFAGRISVWQQEI